MIKIAILGSTGSIGASAVRLILKNPDRFRAVSLSARSNIRELHRQMKQLNPETVAVESQHHGELLKSRYSGKAEIHTGAGSVCHPEIYENADVVLNALVGEAGLFPAYHTLKTGKKLLLANKESLVSGGHLIMPEALKRPGSLIPIDSEHSALFQCLDQRNKEQVSRLILTASGGPFLHEDRKNFHRITVEQALKHPRWKMGPKITIDSATMMNKGLEVIEAFWLFGFSADKISVIIHPQSTVHSLVEFIDGSMISQLGITDMTIPISYALNYPERLLLDQKYRLKLENLRLDFFKPDLKKFPCLKIAYDCLKNPSSDGTVLNAANEEAVSMFLDRQTSFTSISLLITEALSRFSGRAASDLPSLLQLSDEVRRYVRETGKRKKYAL